MDATFPPQDGRLEKAINWYKSHFLSLERSYTPFVANISERGIIGFIIGDIRRERNQLNIVPSPAGYVNSEIDVSHIFVSADWRRKMFGKMLLTSLIEDSRKKGHRVMVATAIPDNNAQISLYKSLGFQEKTGFGGDFYFSLKL
jgi:L-amino acid N-acyltransferase YncA